MTRKLQTLSGSVLLAAVVLLGCPPGTDPGDDGTANSNGSLSAEALPDFSLPDINSASARSNDLISPRDYLEEVSAWYFGHAT